MGAALVLDINDVVMPYDAYIEVFDHDTEETSRHMINLCGYFIIPFDKVESKNLTLKIISDWFPDEASRYIMQARWIASESVSGASPMSGTQLTNPQAFTFSKDETQIPSVKLTSDSDKRIYKTGETISLEAQYANVDTYAVKATLMYKNEGEYVNFGLTKVVDGNNNVEFPLGDIEGSYMVLLKVEDENGYVVRSTPYYFIIQN